MFYKLYTYEIEAWGIKASYHEMIDDHSRKNRARRILHRKKKLVIKIKNNNYSNRIRYNIK